MTNINPKTGIHYGVADMQPLMSLYETITQDGTDNRYESAKRELEGRLEACETYRDVNRIIAEYLNPRWNIEAYLNLRVSRSEFDDYDRDELVEELLREIETDDSDCLSYSYESGGDRYEMNSLGGAPLLWCLETKFVAWCRLCSPCCPNAGDLNHIFPKMEDGEESPARAYLTYCFDPADHETPEKFATEPYEDGLTLVYLKEGAGS